MGRHQPSRCQIKMYSRLVPDPKNLEFFLSSSDMVLFLLVSRKTNPGKFCLLVLMSS
jgi:hypothetical protein